MLFGDNSGYVDALRRSTKVSFNWVVKRQESNFGTAVKRRKDELNLWKEEVKKKKEYIGISFRRRLTSYILIFSL